MKFDCFRKHSIAIDGIRSKAIGGIRLLSIAIGLLCAGARAELIESATARSPATRLDLRDAGTLGRSLVCGTETKGEPDGSASAVWDTTALPEGWQTVSPGGAGGSPAEICVRNDSSIAVEGGRLQSNATWDSGKVHLVRHWVVVPSGVTLTISAGTFVKFCENTGIHVMAGGTLDLRGTKENEVVFASAANDAEGGDTDLRDASPIAGAYDLSAAPGSTMKDTGYTVDEDANLELLPWATLHGAAVSASAGKAYLAVTLSGTRTLPFSIDWETADGTARAGEDYAASSGTLVWTSGTSGGTKWIEVPLLRSSSASFWKDFSVRLTRLRGVNATAAEAAVRLYDAPDIRVGSARSAATRLDLREEGTLGRALVTGVETKGEPDGSSAAPWDTTALPEGWQEVSPGGAGGSPAEICVRNDASVAVEGGRLAASVTWDATSVHLVRHWVVVPSGVTLTIAAGTFVKFCENTGIHVMAGGTLDLRGTKENEVVFASAANDAEGGDTDLRDASPIAGAYDLSAAPGSTVKDTGYTVNEDANLELLPWATLHGAVVSASAGKAYLAVTLSGTRTLPFSIDWETADGTAKAGEDYVAFYGTLVWTSGTSGGTKWIEVPLLRSGDPAQWKDFSVRLTRLRGVNATAADAAVELSGRRISDSGRELEVVQVKAAENAVLDVRDPVIVPFGGMASLSASPSEWAAATSSGTARITCDGAEIGKHTGEGTVEWTADAAGRRVLAHESSAGGVVSREVFVLPQGTLFLDDATLSGATFWPSGTVAVVRGALTVSSDAALTIEPGAVVKFAPGASLAVSPGGTCVAKGAIFTHLHDDTAGGDTLGDGDARAPASGDYSVSGSVADDDATEWRYGPPETTSGTINSDTRWRGWKVYRVTGNLTVASGRTLTIDAGCVVKVDPGVAITVNSGGALRALGTLACPVVFTSARDDEHGGDTNGDGDRTHPDDGDWEELRNSGGVLELVHAKVLYGGYGQYSNQGDAAVRTSAGTTTLDECEVAHSNMRLLGRTGGMVTARNCLLRDGRWGWDGAVDFANGVVARCTTGSNGGTAKNAVYWNCATVSSGTSVSHSIAWGETRPSQSGFTFADPLFLDPDNGDFRIAANSPCVDAADSAAAPETDFYGRPRMNATAVKDTGVPNADGICADIGLHEADGVAMAEAGDFKAVSLSVPASASVGAEIEIVCVATNVGPARLSGTWRDKVTFVSPYGREGGSVAAVAAATLAPDGPAATIRHRVRVPALDEGDWTVRVDLNAWRDLYESDTADGANRVESAVPVAISVAASPLDETSGGSVAPEAPVVRRFDVPEGEPHALRVAAPPGSVVRVGVGGMPSASVSGVAVGADGVAVVSLPAGTAAYVEISGDRSGAVSLAPFAAGLSVLGVSPGTLPQSGEVTLAVSGLHFDSGCAVRLEGPDSVPAEAVRVLSAERIDARFDCSKLAAGTTYDLVVAADGGSATHPGAVRVSGTPAAPKLKASLDMPASLRAGRAFVFYIDYANVGNADMPAPVFTVASDQMAFTTDYGAYDGSVRLLGLGAEGSAGVLRPGESFRLPVKARVKATAGGTIQYALKASWIGSEDAHNPLQLESLISKRWVYDHFKTDDPLYGVMSAKFGATHAAFYTKLGAFLTEAIDGVDAALSIEEAVEAFAANAYAEILEANRDFSNRNLSRSEVRTVSPKSRCDHTGRVALESTDDVRKDNSYPGDIWEFCPKCKWWYKPLPNSLSGKNVAILAHGLNDSIHGSWMRDMADAIMANGRFHVVIGCDYGDSENYRTVPFHYWTDPMTGADSIPKDSAVACVHLYEAGVNPSTATLIGHSHGGHFTGHIAQYLSDGRYDENGMCFPPSRLIGLDTSPVGVHWYSPRYPQAWNAHSARQTELYKSSWSYSLGTTKETEVFGNPTFFVVEDRKGSFHRDQLINAVDHHGYCREWLTKDLGAESSPLWDGSDGNAIYRTLSGYSRDYEENSFAGVVRYDEKRGKSVMECGAALRGELGADEKDWLLDKTLGNGGYPKTMQELQNRMALIAEWGLDGFSIRPASDSQDGKLRNGAVASLKFLNLTNAADNISTDYDSILGKAARFPWNLTGSGQYDGTGIGTQVWAIDMDGLSADFLAEARNGSKGARLTEAQVKSLASRAKSAILKDYYFTGIAGAFRKPQTGGDETFDGAKLDIRFGSRRAGYDADGNPKEDGEEVLFVAVAGALRRIDGKAETSIKFYPYELWLDDNCRAVVARVYPDRDPNAQTDAGTATGASWATRRSARTHSVTVSGVSITDDNTWEADETGAWSVCLTGIRSTSPTNIVCGRWSGEDCAVSEPDWSSNPNVTVSGVLPIGGDGQPVPVHSYTVSLTVKDANGATNLVEHSFEIHRKPDDPSGDSFGGGSSVAPQSCDPNEMVGPDGAGGDRVLLPGEEATYTIFFENKSDADAPAQFVTVEADLSPQLDWSTFEMLDVGFGLQTDIGLLGKRNGTSDATMEGTNLVVRTEVAFDEQTGRARWFLRIVTPYGDEDGWPYANDPTGFLPPNDPETHCGEGHLTYRVKVRADAAPGARIDAAATIVFDYNDPIPTDPAWWNTVGALATPLPVHRFYSKAYKGHFFTISEDEKEDLIAHNPNWKYEGTAYRAYTNETAGTTKLYRFYSKNYRGHFFTIDAEEAEGVKLNRNWKYEGVAYYVYPTEVEGSVPVFRFWSKGYRHHFYTTNEAEKDNLIATNPNWKYEGVAFYALPEEESGKKASSARNAGAIRMEGATQADVSGRLDGADSTRDVRKDAETGADDARNDRRGAERASAAQTAEALAPAPWTLVALPDAVSAAEPGVAEIGDVIVETRADAPDADELEAGGAGVSPAGELVLRLTLPGGAFDATLWSAAEGPLAEEKADGAFDFALPADGVWHWLRIRDAEGDCEDAFSVWLRAE